MSSNCSDQQKYHVKYAASVTLSLLHGDVIDALSLLYGDVIDALSLLYGDVIDALSYCTVTSSARSLHAVGEEQSAP